MENASNHLVSGVSSWCHVVPMRSRTREPFHTTNLVVMVLENGINKSKNSEYITYGDALLMDPGCCTQFHSELADLVAALPRKLVIFVSHRHYDHTDGLSAVQKCNPDSILLAHDNTMNQIYKGARLLGQTLISGGKKIHIGGQDVQAIGHGSVVLDVRDGGNMKDYFLITYNFLELLPYVLIPMHGRINL